MIAFLIPIFIVIFITIFSAGGENIFKSVGDSFFHLRPYFFVTKATDQKEQKRSPSPSALQKSTAPSLPVETPVIPKSTPPEPTPVAPQAQSANSPYFKKIRISSVRPTKDNEPALIILSTSFSDETPINITGWKLKSQWRGETIFGKGIEKFRSMVTLEALDNILVKRSDTLYVRGEQSPFGRGRSFKSNQCFGYLIQYYPSLPGSYSCSKDRPAIQDIQHLKPVCQEYILQKVDYSSCKPPDFNDLSIVGDSECKAYLTGTEGSFTYQGCYEKRSKDANFLSNRWDIYIERSFGHPLHDAITLLDQTGLTVDTYIY